MDPEPAQPQSLLRSSLPAVQALHTRRGALAVEEPACRDWMVTGQRHRRPQHLWAVSVIVITKVLGRGTERAVGRKVRVRLRLSEMCIPLGWFKVRRAASLASQNVT